MPLYTFVVCYRGRTAVLQKRKSNPKGWIADVVREAFPILAPRAVEILREELVPLPNLVGAWRLSRDINGEDVIIYAIETRG